MRNLTDVEGFGQMSRNTVDTHDLENALKIHTCRKHAPWTRSNFRFLAVRLHGGIECVHGGHVGGLKQ